MTEEDSVATEEAQPEQNIGERIREAFAGLDINAAMRVAFGKCPKCGKRLVSGYWLRWCPDRTCNGYRGLKNKELGRKIAYVLPQTEAEREFVRKMRDADQEEIDAAVDAMLAQEPMP